MPKKYSKDQRNTIGKRIYDGELTVHQAALEYDVHFYTARDYFREYKATIRDAAAEGKPRERSQRQKEFSRYEDMSRDELMDELIRSRIENERLKKGYRQRGGGPRGLFEILEPGKWKS